VLGGESPATAKEQEELENLARPTVVARWRS